MTMARRHIGMSDDGWEARKGWMRENTALALINNEYPHAFRQRNPDLVMPVDPDSCAPFCPECHGESMTINAGGCAVECSRYRIRKNKRAMLEAAPEESEYDDEN